MQTTTADPAKKRSGRKLPRPFLKWVGGKGQLLEELRRSAAPFTGTYHEPFVGGGALFFDLLPARAVLSDRNRELIDCYTAVRDSAPELIAALGEHRYEREHYYAVRALDPDALDPVRRAARTIYLNRAGFNGLYRVNRAGRFNVPFGRYENPTICDAENLLACSVALRDASLACRPFEAVLDSARAGDFVYFDPPYVPLSDTAHFTAYQQGGFSERDQVRLRELFDALTAQGVAAMLSNADVPWIHDQYRAHRIRVVQASRAVNSNAGRRGPVGEVIVTNY